MELMELTKKIPEPDLDCLESKGYIFNVLEFNNEIHIIIENYPFPSFYSPQQASLLIMLPAGYPNANPDMFWTCPDVKLTTGAWPLASEHHQMFHGKNWQRWSRHFPGNWRPGIDGLRTYLASIKTELSRGK